jgi:hypothetical protein
MVSLTQKELALSKFVSKVLRGKSERKKAEIRFTVLGFLARNQDMTIRQVLMKAERLIANLKKKRQL